MDQHEATARPSAAQLSRFEFAPPRNFLLPAILLLVSEEPGYGYGLVKRLREFRFGTVDRPAVYRALAQLEADGLLESWADAAAAGQARHVYGVTVLGERVLRSWMGVIKEERTCLDEVLRRYQATGTVDAALAGIEGQWVTALGRAWSSVSSTSPSHGRHKRAAGTLSSIAAAESEQVPAGESSSPPTKKRRARSAAPSAATRYHVVPDRSVVLIEARSSVGPISFGAAGLTGYIDADCRGGEVNTRAHPAARLEIAVGELRSGNSLYDAELLRRIDARRFPTVTIELHESTEIRSEQRLRLGGTITFHGLTRPVEGTVTVKVAAEDKLVVAGEQVFDIRDFDIASPTMLMLRIYPDVRVRLHLEAELRD